MIAFLIKLVCSKGESSQKESYGRRPGHPIRKDEEGQKELQDKFAQMMDMMVGMSNGKGVSKNHGSQEGHCTPG